MYTTTINQNGMILINKAVREALGLKLGDKVTVTFDTQSARVERKMSDEEFIKRLDDMKSARTKNRIKELAGKTANELFDMAMQKTTKGDTNV